MCDYTDYLSFQIFQTAYEILRDFSSSPKQTVPEKPRKLDSNKVHFSYQGQSPYSVTLDNEGKSHQ